MRFFCLQPSAEVRAKKLEPAAEKKPEPELKPAAEKKPEPELKPAEEKKPELKPAEEMLESKEGCAQSSGRRNDSRENRPDAQVLQAYYA